MIHSPLSPSNFHTVQGLTCREGTTKSVECLHIEPDVVPATMAAPSSANQPTAHDWQTVQPRIRKLYVQDKLPLKTVLSVLREKHGFKVT